MFDWIIGWASSEIHNNFGGQLFGNSGWLCFDITDFSRKVVRPSIRKVRLSLWLFILDVWEDSVGFHWLFGLWSNSLSLWLMSDQRMLFIWLSEACWNVGSVSEIFSTCGSVSSSAWGAQYTVVYLLLSSKGSVLAQFFLDLSLNWTMVESKRRLWSF